MQVEVLELGADGVPTPLRICKPRFINSMPEVVSEELDNFKDSFGKDWQEWDLKDLRSRLKDNWTFYLTECGWCFIDWNRKYPYLCNRYIIPEYRNKGLGSDLVWLRCNEIKQQGYNYASIKLEDWNKPALSVMKEDIFTELTEI